MDPRTGRQAARRTVVTALIAPLLAGCANNAAASDPGSPAGTPTPSAPAPRSAPATDLRSELDGLVSASGADLQIVVSGTGSSVTSAGKVDTSTGWSTMKVPVAIAALQNGSGDMDDVDQAITLSDNDAAARLWDTLGGGTEAADTVQTVIRRFGDGSTVVLPDDQAGPDVPFGMTQWTAVDQVRFVDALACSTDPSAVAVRDYMAEIDPSEQFGLAGIHPSMVKSGWGDEDDGDYTVRQMAILPQAGGYSAVTLIAQGDQDDVEQTIDTLKTWFTAHRKDLPVRRCA